MIRFGKLALAIALLASIWACSRVTPDNYNKVEAGMPRAEVYKILGKPDDVGGGSIGALEMSSEVWRGHSHTVSITFGNGKVVVKSIGEASSKTDKPETPER
jgi:outer membrane protein assembly factor BamE (lipoprotein component of BamABCDE complex)